VTESLTLVIPATPSAIPVVTDNVVHLLESYEWSEDEILKVDLALQEALANGIRHGCKSDPTKHVQSNLFKPSGRGVFLINQLMDEVDFADGGREVRMRRHRRR
jgi:anti-sigma regulatory factor (Ser/Thr protein kinase)